MPNLGYHSGGEQSLEPIRQNIGGDSLGAFEKLFILMLAVKDKVPDNQEGPFIPEDIQHIAYGTRRATASAGRTDRFIFALEL